MLAYPGARPATDESMPAGLWGKRLPMASQKDVRAIALSLPGVCEEAGRFAFSLEHGGKQHGIVWSWKERLHPRKPKVPRDGRGPASG